MNLEAKNITNRWWPFFVSAVIFLAVTGFVLNVSLNLTQQFFTYEMDDVYIHLAIARNLAEHGVWGVTPSGFSSASSSPLWTLLLSSCYFFGCNSIWTALVLNIAICVLILAITNIILLQEKVTAGLRLLILLLLLFSAHLPQLAFFGMEHTLQILLLLPFAYIACLILSGGGQPGEKSKLNFMLIALAMVLPTVRYESLFVILAVCILLFLDKRYVFSILLGLSSLLLPLLFGFYSIANGGYILPNSLLTKSPAVSLSFNPISMVMVLAYQLLRSPEFILLALAIAILAFVIIKKSPISGRPGGSFFFIVGFAIILHNIFSFSKINFGRYEAYIIALGVLAIGVTVWRHRDYLFKRAGSRRASGSTVLAFVLLALVFTGRGITLIKETPAACKNVYEQQIQSSRFLKQFYSGKQVVINDIGAIAYYSPVEIIDLAGLATMDITRAILAGRYTDSFLKKYVKENQAPIVVCHMHAFPEHRIPEGWTEVGSWTIHDNVVNASPTVYVVSPSPALTTKISEEVSLFQKQLPGDVSVSDNFKTQPAEAPKDSRLPKRVEVLN